MKIINGKIANGFGDILKYMRLNPSDVVCSTSIAISENDPQILNGLFCNQNYTYGRHQNAISLTRGQSKTVVFKSDNEMLEYLYKYSIITENIYQLPETEAEALENFHDNSIDSRLLYYYSNSKDLSFLDKKIIYSEFASSKSQELAKITNGKTILNPQQSLCFNSKAYIRENDSDKKYNYNLSPFVLINSIDEIDIKIKKFCEKVNNLGICSEQTKIWLKQTTSLGGDASFSCNFVNEDLQKIKDYILSYNKNIIFKPFLLDIDVYSLPNNKMILSNGYVQPVIYYSNFIICEDKIVNLDAEIQISDEFGASRGSLSLSNDDKKYSGVAHEASISVAKKLFEDGYIGFANVDIAIVENKNSFVAYVLETNCRTSGTTPHLSVKNFVENLSNKEKFHVVQKIDFLNSRLSFSESTKLLGDMLYKGMDSSYKGYVPLIFRHRGTKTQLSSVGLYDSYEELLEAIEKVNKITNDFKGK